MAYSTPRWWKFGDTTTVSDFQKYKDNLVVMLPQAVMGANMAQATLVTPHVTSGLITEDLGRAALIHTSRWLYYLNVESSGGSAKIKPVDPSLGEDVSLSNVTPDGGFYDLEKIDWLMLGMIYKVEGCIIAMEYENIGFDSVTQWSVTTGWSHGGFV